MGHTPSMGKPIAIVVGSALIAAAILITNHWQLQRAANDATGAIRLNRWTGKVEICVIEAKSIHPSDINSLAGARLACSPQ